MPTALKHSPPGSILWEQDLASDGVRNGYVTSGTVGHVRPLLDR